MQLEKFQNINDTIFTSSSNTLGDILSHWPEILSALGIVVVGFFIMKIIKWIIVKTAKKLSLHYLSDKSGFTDLLNRANVKSSPSEVIGKFLGGYVFTMFFLAAARVLKLSAISDFLNKVINYIPQIVVALFILLLGMQIAETTKAIVESTLRLLNNGGAKVIAEFSKYVIILFAVLTALIQLNIAEELVRILFIGVISSLSIATGLALGLGAKDFVSEFLQEIQKKK